jgi:hypothetical protein
MCVIFNTKKIIHTKFVDIFIVYSSAKCYIPVTNAEKLLPWNWTKNVFLMDAMLLFYDTEFQALSRTGAMLVLLTVGN